MDVIKNKAKLNELLVNVLVMVSILHIFSVLFPHVEKYSPDFVYMLIKLPRYHIYFYNYVI